MHWLVDGMNVIGTRPDAWWRDRHGAMVRLVDLLERWSVASGEDVTVVFEKRPNPPIVSSVVEVAHAPRAKANAADDEIVRLLKAMPSRAATWVVTSDHGLADQAHALGCAVESSAAFRARIEAAAW